MEVSVPDRPCLNASGSRFLGLVSASRRTTAGTHISSACSLELVPSDYVCKEGQFHCIRKREIITSLAFANRIAWPVRRTVPVGALPS